MAPDPHCTPGTLADADQFHRLEFLAQLLQRQYEFLRDTIACQLQSPGCGIDGGDVHAVPADEEPVVGRDCFVS